MGIWGTGPFESDTGMELVGSLLDSVKAKLRSAIADCEADPSSKRNVLPALATLRVLVTEADAETMISKAEVRAWQSRIQGWLSERARTNDSAGEQYEEQAITDELRILLDKAEFETLD